MSAGALWSSVSALWITQSTKRKDSIIPNYTFPRYPENKDTLISLSERKAKIKTESQLKEECVVVAAPHPLVLVKICKAFLLFPLLWKPVKCRTSSDRSCFVTFIFLSFFSHRSLIGFCLCRPLMWSLYTQLKWMYTRAGFEEEEEEKKNVFQWWRHKCCRSQKLLSLILRPRVAWFFGRSAWVSSSTSLHISSHISCPFATWSVVYHPSSCGLPLTKSPSCVNCTLGQTKG